MGSSDAYVGVGVLKENRSLSPDRDALPRIYTGDLWQSYTSRSSIIPIGATTLLFFLLLRDFSQCSHTSERIREKENDNYNARNSIWEVWAILEILGQPSCLLRQVMFHRVAIHQQISKKDPIKSISRTGRHLHPGPSQQAGKQAERALSVRNCSGNRISRMAQCVRRERTCVSSW